MLYGPSMVGQAFGPVTMKSTETANAFMYRMTAQTAGIGTACTRVPSGVYFARLQVDGSVVSSRIIRIR